MLIMRYKKYLQAEYISHLDTLRHIVKTLKRAEIQVEYSKGFNPHALVYLSSPIYVGLESDAEYCLIETDEKADEFREKFNAYSPKGIKCIKAFGVTKKHKIAGLIDSAKYSFTFKNEISGAEKILENESIELVDKRGKTIDIRPLIFGVKADKNVLYANLAFGNTMLRADIFAEYLNSLFGEKPYEKKLEAYIGGKLPEDILN
ncbi:MAG: TIGR03936 family radical SAM-associated protein [Christensenellaceae bacterium]